jgi:hypothetical protein
LTYLINGAIVALTAFLPLNIQLLSNAELHEAIHEIDPAAYSKMDGHIAIGFNVSFVLEFLDLIFTQPIFCF